MDKILNIQRYTCQNYKAILFKQFLNKIQAKQNNFLEIQFAFAKLDMKISTSFIESKLCYCDNQEIPKSYLCIGRI